MENGTSVQKYLDEKKNEMLALLEKLVNIDSGTRYREGANQLIEVILPVLGKLGFEAKRLSQPDFGDHVLARKSGSSPKRLLCAGHMDTVFGEGEARKRPFRIEGDKAYGPGVIDMKGGIVVLLYSLLALKERDPDFYNLLNLALLFNSDEEVASPSSRPYFEEEAQKADAVCVFEPARPGGEVVIKRKGVGMYFLHVYGRAAHAGAQPELGLSAIEEIAHKVLELHALTDFKGGLTVNVGVIKGGSRFNIVADQAQAEIDVRVVNQGQLERLEKEFQRIAQPHREGLRIELTGGIQFPPMLKTKRSLELFGLYQEAGRELGIDIREVPTGGGSDGCRTSQSAPTIDALGPQGTGNHTADETLLIPTLVHRAKIFAVFLKKWEKHFAPKGDYPGGLAPLL